MFNSLIYILATLGANYTAAWFLPFAIGSQVSVGTFIFAITFSQRDRIHHLGRVWVYSTLAIAAVANIIMSAVLSVPPRIIIASFVAILIAEGIDTEIFQALKARSWHTRVACSNAVSVPVDTLIFTTIAFGGVLTMQGFVSLLLGEVLLKWGIAFLISLHPGKTNAIP
jgi:uncharacterized PurR-regulated membrane protein YhhQ (DUF165 family)